MATETGGPYVQMAAICERVLQEKDGVLSIIRLIDRYTTTARGTDPPEEMPPTSISPTIVVMLKSGFVRGRYTLKIVPNSPTGKRLNELSTGLLLEGEDRGVNVVLKGQMVLREEGLYWFDVMFEKQLLTRIPLRLVYQRVTQGPLPEAPRPEGG